MAVTSTPALPQAPKSSKIQILNATGTGLVTAYTGGANGSKITAVIAASTDTAGQNVTIGITNGATFYPLGTFSIPASSGTASGTPPVNLLDPTIIKGLPIDNDGNPYIFLTSASDTLQVESLATITSGKIISINSFGADF